MAKSAIQVLPPPTKGDIITADDSILWLDRAAGSVGEVLTVQAGGALGWSPASGGASQLDDLNDVTITTPALGDYLRHDGSFWVDVAKSQLLTDLLTLDGSGSGLDADLLDGIDSTGFSLVGHSHTFSLLNVGTTTDAIAAGDFAAGLTGADPRVFLDASAATWLFNGVTPSAPGAGTSSEHFGAGSSAAGDYSAVFGSATTAAFNYSMALGYHADTTAANQLVMGSAQGPLTAAYIGEGVTSATPQDLTLQATGGSGSNIAAGSFNIAVGRSTGSATPGKIVFQTTLPGSSGGLLQALQTSLTLDQSLVTVAGYLRVSKSTRAVAIGDFSAGSSTTAELFFDASAKTLGLYSGGLVINQLSMVPGIETIFNKQGGDIDFRVSGQLGHPNLLRTDAGLSLVETDGGRRVQLDTINSSTTLNSAHHVVHVDTSGGNVTVTLPAASSNAGQLYVIKHGDSGASSGNACRLSRSGADTIDVALTVLAVTWGTTTVVVSDGTSTWRVLGSSY